jgi:hypothetical protein
VLNKLKDKLKTTISIVEESNYKELKETEKLINQYSFECNEIIMRKGQDITFDKILYSLKKYESSQNKSNLQKYFTNNNSLMFLENDKKFLEKSNKRKLDQVSDLTLENEETKFIKID